MLCYNSLPYCRSISSDRVTLEVRTMADLTNENGHRTEPVSSEPHDGGTAQPTTSPQTPYHAAGRKRSSAGSKTNVKRKTTTSILNNPASMSTPAGLAIAEEAQALVSEANANTQAMIDAVSAVIQAETPQEIIRATLDTIRKEFGWSYASYWVVDPVENVLVFSQESGRVDDEFQRLTRTARFREGEGLNGRSWRLRDLFHAPDIGELHDCCRAPSVRRAGIKGAVALPVMRDGRVVGTLDFFSTQEIEVSQARLGTLRVIGRLASDKFSKLARQAELIRIKQMIENAPVNVMYADRDLKLQYMNATSIRTFKKLEQLLPVKVNQMIGQSLDIFHKNPEHQRRLLADPRNLPYSATIRLGSEILELTAAAIIDQSGEYWAPW